MNRALAAWLAAACALHVPSRAFASEAREEATAPPIMRVYVSGSAAAVARLSATIRELCARLNLDVVVEEASGESVLEAAPAARLKSFVDLKSRSPRVVVVDARTSREVERRALPNSASLEMSVEEAAHVLYMAAESAFSARSPNPSPTTQTPPEPARTAEGPGASDGGAPKTGEDGARPPENAKPKPVETRRQPEVQREPEPVQERDHGDEHPKSRNGSSRFESQVGAFGTAAVFGASLPLFGLAASLDGGVRSGAFRLSGAISLGAYLPSTLTRNGARASLQAEVARLDAVAAWEATAALAPFLAIGGGADRITMTAGTAPLGGQAAGTEARVDPMLEALLGAKIRMTSAFRAFFAFGADIDLAPHRYVIDTDGAHQTFLELGRVRPTALLGLSIDVATSSDGSATGEADP